jgi:sarcosine oxidase, subunit gamma
VASGLVDILCVGPSDWLVVGGPSDGAAAELCGRIEAAVLGSPLRATDLSQAFTVVEIEGPEAREFLLKGCSLDLHPDHFPVGRCARTRFAGVPTVLCCRGAQRFEGIVAASYREYVLGWIADAQG